MVEKGFRDSFISRGLSSFRKVLLSGEEALKFCQSQFLISMQRLHNIVNGSITQLLDGQNLAKPGFLP